MGNDTRRGWFRLRQTLAGLGVMLASAGWALAQTGNDGFATAISAGSVHDVVVDNNGKILVGGNFTLSSATRRVARLFPDGSRDTGFSLGITATSGYARSILPIGGGYLVGGTFTGGGGSSPDYLAQLGPNGANVPGLAVAVNGAVYKVARRYADNGYYIGGQFTWVNGATRYGLARLTASLTSDTGFVTPAFEGSVYDVLEQGDGKVIVAGAFLSITGNPGAGYAVFRLNSNGSLDTSFTFDAVPAGLHHVLAVAAQPDGKLLIAGTFTATAGGQERRRIARLNTDGSLDLSFQGPTLNAEVQDIAVQPDGRIVIGGAFTGVGLASEIARLHSDGAVDFTFSPLVDPDNTVRAVAMQGDGGVLFAGDFTALTGGVPALRVARIPRTGVFDRDFEPGGTTNGDVLAMALLANGDVIAGGAFTTIAGQSRTYLARFAGAAGLLSSGFTPTLNGAVHAVVVQPDGKFLVGGAFELVNGTTRRRVARFNADGTLDTGFVPANIPDGVVYAIEVAPDGRIYVGGSFQNVGGQARPHLVRLNANGSVDADFEDRGVDGAVRVIAMAGDAYRIYIGGEFNNVDGFMQRKLARMWPNGGVNSGFRGQALSTSARINALSVPPSGVGVIVGGEFLWVRRADGTAFQRSNLARFLDDGSVDIDFASNAENSAPNASVLAIHAVHDEYLYIGGAFNEVGSSTRVRLARLHADTGALDTAFNVAVTMPALLPSWVNTLALQGDGRLLVGGHFDHIGGVARSRIGRIGNRHRVPSESLLVDLPGMVYWQRGDVGVGLRGAPQLLVSTTCCASGDFEPLPGTMTWSPLAGGQWRYEGFANPYGVFYLRTRARIGDGSGSGFYESPIHRFDGGEKPEDQANLEVTKIVTPTEAEPGQTVTFTVQVRNLGPDPATGTAALEELPSGYNYVSHSVTQGTFNPVDGQWAIGTLAAAGAASTRVLTLVATVNADGDHLNVASASSDAFDPNILNNVDSAAVIVLEPNDDTIFANGFEVP